MSVMNRYVRTAVIHFFVLFLFPVAVAAGEKTKTHVQDEVKKDRAKKVQSRVVKPKSAQANDSKSKTPTKKTIKSAKTNKKKGSKPNLLKNKRVKKFISMMIKKHGFKQQELEELFSKTVPRKIVVKKMKKPAEKRPWYKYHPLHVYPKNIKRGAQFWKKYEKWLIKAEQKYGVPREIIVGLLGVETRYGRIQGSHRVIDSLSTFAFIYTRRSKFFTSELKNFLLMAKENKFDPLSLTGSYAGAMGIPQFMPSSFRRYAIDFDGDGKKDIWKNEVDAIGSVANYLKEKGGWQAGKPIYSSATVVVSNPEKKTDKKSNSYEKVMHRNSLRPSFNLAKIKAAGVTILDEDVTKLADDSAALLMSVQSAKGKEDYLVGLANFWAIARYNPRLHYVMAVIKLGKEVKVKFNKTDLKNTNKQPARAKKKSAQSNSSQSIKKLDKKEN